MAEEFVSVPPLTDTAYWERNLALGLHQPMSDKERAEIEAELRGEPSSNGTGNYAWINLNSPEYATPPSPPSIKGILYAGRRHVISGPPESLKTLIAYMLLLEALRQGEGVCILDFEMGPHAAATLLRELGANPDELAAIHYTEPGGPPTAADIARIVGLGVGYVLVDAAAGAYDATGLDDNKRQDAEKFASQWIRPLWQQGIATTVIDHVTKNIDTRGKYAIGSERKTGQADVHLSLDALKPLHRGGSGLVKINVHKDRPGHLPRPTVYVVELTSDEQHQISWELRAPLATETSEGDFRHTIYMERISRHMQLQPDHLYSKNELEQGVEGKAEYIRAGLTELIEDEHVIVVEGGKYLKYHLVRPFVPGSSQLVPDEVSVQLVPSSHPYKGDEGRDEPAGDEQPQLVPPSSSRPIDVYDPEVQRLLDDPTGYDRDIPF